MTDYVVTVTEVFEGRWNARVSLGSQVVFARGGDSAEAALALVHQWIEDQPEQPEAAPKQQDLLALTMMEEM